MSAALAGIRCVVLGDGLSGLVAANLLRSHGADVRQHSGSGRGCYDSGLSGADVIIVAESKYPAGCSGSWPHAIAAASANAVIWRVTAFPAADERDQAPAPGLVVAAAAGAVRAAPRACDELELLRPLDPVAAVYTGVHGAVAIAAALFARASGGLGRILYTSQVDAFRDLAVDPTRNPDEALLSSRQERAADGFERRFSFALGGSYRCSDGQTVLFWPRRGKFMARFRDAVGPADWDRWISFDTDSALRTSVSRAEAREQVGALFVTRSADAWERLGIASRVPLVRYRTYPQWRRLATDLGIVSANSQADLAPSTVATVSALERGSDLPQPARAHAWRRHLDPAGTPGPLDGVKVVDATHILAGPTAGRVLAAFGAEVIRVSSPKAPVSSFHYRINQGKFCIEANVFSGLGRTELEALLGSADIFLHSFAPDRAQQAGLDPATVARSAPNIVHGAVSAYGEHGEWRSGRGYEMLARAMAGLGSTEAWPAYAIDFTTGLLLAYGVCIGLLERDRTHRGQSVGTNLLMAAHLYASATAGSCVPYRIETGRYEVVDGAILLAVSDAQAAVVDAVLGVAGCEGGGRVAAWRDAFRGQPASFWVLALRAAGLAVHEVCSTAEALRDPIAVAQGTVQVVQDGGRQVRTIGLPHIDPSRRAAPLVRLPRPLLVTKQV